MRNNLIMVAALSLLMGCNEAEKAEKRKPGTSADIGKNTPDTGNGSGDATDAGPSTIDPTRPINSCGLRLEGLGLCSIARIPTEPVGGQLDNFKCESVAINHNFKADKSTIIVSVDIMAMVGRSSLKIYGDGTVVAIKGSTPNSPEVTSKLSTEELQSFLQNFSDKTCLTKIESAAVAEKVKKINDAMSGAPTAPPMPSDCGFAVNFEIHTNSINYKQSFDSCISFATNDAYHARLAEQTYFDKAAVIAGQLIDKVTQAK